MNKQILNRGYITNALTDGKHILGLIKDHQINFELSITPYYWSEVYCEPGNMAIIIRQGTLLLNTTPEKLKEYYEQSKVNLN